MAPRKPVQKFKTTDDSRSWQDVAVQTVFGKPGYQEMGLGGAKALVTKAVVAVAKTKVAKDLAKTAKKSALKVGAEVADYVPKTAKVGKDIVRTTGQVFTPQGVFQGKDVFIKKAPLTDKQRAAVQKGLETKAFNQYVGKVKTGAAGALVGGAAGVVGGALGGQAAVNTAKDVVKFVKSRGGGAKKR